MTDFVPPNLDATRWSNLQPLYQALIDRPLKCDGCLKQLLLDRSELDAATSEARASLYIKMTCHTDDASAKRAFLDFVKNVEPDLKKASFELDKKIAASPHADKLDSSRFKVLLRNLKADVEIFREDNIPIQTQETELVQQFDEISGAMTVMFRGEERTLPQMGRFFEDTDRATREEAWRAVADRRFQDSERLSDIFDQLVALRHQMARNAGFTNYLEYTFKRKHRFDYTPQTCRDFHRGCEEVFVPMHRELNRERAAALMVSSLRPWDMAVDVKGRSPLKPFATSDELVEKSSRLFHKLDPGPNGLGALFDTMRHGDSLDLDSRKGKAPGGYQESLDRQRRPFIFMNAAGLQRDLITMIHEAGHAFHSMLCQNEPLLDYRHPPIEYCEVASMAMELLAFPHLNEFYNDSDAQRAIRTHLEEMAQRIPWIATIDAFQHWIYTNPTHTRQERTAAWIDLDRRFGSELDWSGLEKYRETMWQRQLHLFSVPLYYIEYGIAQLGALQLWLTSRRNTQAALASYKNGLSLGGALPLPDLFKASDIKFDFGPDMMKGLKEEIRDVLATLPA